MKSLGLGLAAASLALGGVITAGAPAMANAPDVATLYYTQLVKGEYWAYTDTVYADGQFGKCHRLRDKSPVDYCIFGRVTDEQLADIEQAQGRQELALAFRRADIIDDDELAAALASPDK
jgi:hypothetical protein